MDTAWRFRLVLICTFAIIIFGDILGYANVKGDKDSNGNHQRTVDSTLKKNQHNRNQHQNIEDSPSTEDIEDFISKKSNSNTKLLQIDLKDKITLANHMREACLPKLLCEIAAKPSNVITEKEQNLLDLIRSTTLSFVWQYSTPTKWHFAAHMGQLMRDTIDSFGRAAGCSELWPQCPFNSATLLQLNKKDGGSLSGY
ncbi:uncharacterized protein LOC116340836 [Contarinia nasturtii]|uniref:uncharacterized protein LOC116340836 n=1 Tax=Contarinia nasturtii TaxID=265458 RepID=UPI0012D485DC|nr:uncharacterized protein LOC116340836 [Contarinia nasturtii]